MARKVLTYWTFYQKPMDGKWYASRRLGGKVYTVYIGLNQEEAESKIRRYCSKRNLIPEAPPMGHTGRKRVSIMDLERRVTALERNRMKNFPILYENNRINGPRNIPWEKAEEFREQAEKNHNQTLERLAERGGLSPVEIWCAGHGKPLSNLTRWPEIDHKGAIKWIEEFAYGIVCRCRRCGVGMKCQILELPEVCGKCITHEEAQEIKKMQCR